MSTYTVRRVVTTREEYVIPLPTNWAEVGKVFAAIRVEFPEVTYDDQVSVTSDGEELVFAITLNNDGSGRPVSGGTS